MATISSAQSGKWSLTTTWVGGVVPVDGDAVNIGAAHIVEFDVDQSGFANGLGKVTVSGQLVISTSAGAYYMKLKSTLVGSGKLIVGSEETPYPDNCTMTFYMNGSTAYIQMLGSPSLYLFCSEPIVRYVKLVGDHAAGETVLTVDTDVSSYTNHWKTNALININNNGRRDSEERMIASVGVGTITITTGLTKAKTSGSYVPLISRNIKLLGTKAADTSSIAYILGGTVNAEIRRFYYGARIILNGNIGGTISDCTQGMYGGRSCIINNVMSNCSSYGYNLGQGHNIIGIITGVAYPVTGYYRMYLNGDVQGSTEVCSLAVNLVLGGEIHHCDTVFWGCSAIEILPTCNIHDNNILINDLGLKFYPVITGYGAIVEDAALKFDPSILDDFYGIFIVNESGIDGNSKSWQAGGKCKISEIEFPTGYSRSHHLTLSAAIETAINITGFVNKNGKLTLTWYVKKDEFMDYPPRLWMHEKFSKPLLDPSLILLEKVMDDTVDEWMEYELEYNNSGRPDKQIMISIFAKNASGNVYTLIDIPEGSSGGGISRSRIIGGV